MDGYRQIDLREALRHTREIHRPLEGFNKTNNYLEKLRILRKFYLHNQDRIIARPDRFFTSYPIDWSTLFTPIETLAWNSIRSKGRIILYPQYPVLNYHVDFGNPFLKIALELDGKDYHDAEKDTNRDLELAKEGWRVYRISGKEMHRTNYKDFSDLDDADLESDEAYTEIRNWVMNTGDGVIEAIKAVYFTKRFETLYFEGACFETLQNHMIVKW